VHPVQIGQWRKTALAQLESMKNRALNPAVAITVALHLKRILRTLGARSCVFNYLRDER
jgi:hypothetical protein